MGVRVDTTRHDITAGCIYDFIAGEIVADSNDLFAFDENIGFKGAVSRDDGSAFDDLLPLFVVPLLVLLRTVAVVDGCEISLQFQQSPIPHAEARRFPPTPIPSKYPRLHYG